MVIVANESSTLCIQNRGKISGDIIHHKISCTGYVVFSHHLEFSFWNNYFRNFYLKTCSMNFLGSFCYFYIPNFSQNEAEKQKLGSIHFWCSGEVVLSSCITFNMHGYKAWENLDFTKQLKSYYWRHGTEF